jgi:hypothetical protein
VRVSRSKGGALRGKGTSFLEELSWRAHLLERRRAHGMEMELEASLRAHLGMRSARLEGEGFSSL